MAIRQDRLGFFNARLEQRMNEVGLSARQLAARVDGTYEHIRKMIKGDCLPSDALLDRLCTALNMSRKDMAKRVARDRLIFKYGDAGWEFLGVNPRLGPACILMPLTRPAQRDGVIAVWKAMVAVKLQKGNPGWKENVSRKPPTH